MIDKKVLAVGDLAQDFSLKDQNKKDFRLSDFEGKKILLSFHPLAWTPVCAKQMVALEKNQEVFSGLNTEAVGLSIDSLFTKYAWAKQLGIQKTRLLADFWPHGGVAGQFGIFRQKEGFSQRANIIVGPDKKIIFVKIYEIPELPDIEEILSFLKMK